MSSLAFDGHKNFSYSTVLTAPSPAISGLSLVLASGDGSKFPTAPFNAVVWPTGTQPTTANAEIVRVTGISTDTLTIVRAQEGTAARTIVVGDQIAVAITAKLFSDLETGSSGSVSFTADDSMKRITITDASVTTTSKIQLSIRRADVTDAADPGWLYITNVVTQTNGTFDVLIAALDWDSPMDSTVPNETVTIIYRVWN